MTLANTAWRGAGVLPYTVAAGGEVLVLLGQEFVLAPHTQSCVATAGGGAGGGAAASAAPGVSQPPPRRQPRYRSWWSDFGGGREPSDADAEHTAAREFSEETVGLFGDGSDLVTRVLNSTAIMRRRLVETGAPPTDSASAVPPPTNRPVFAVVHDTYTMYCCPVSHVDSLMFQLARDENDAAQKFCASGEHNDSIEKRCGEKRDFCWVSLRSLSVAIAAGRLRVRAVDGMRIALLPRLAFALRACAPPLLDSVEATIATADLAAGTPPTKGKRVELIVPPPSRGRCLYLTEIVTQLAGKVPELSSPPKKAVVGLSNSNQSTASAPSTPVPGASLQILLAETCGLFGAVDRAVLYRQVLGGAFALVSFSDAADASTLQEWMASCQSSANTATSFRTPNGVTARMCEAARVVRAEFAFFEPRADVWHNNSVTSNVSCVGSSCHDMAEASGKIAEQRQRLSFATKARGTEPNGLAGASARSNGGYSHKRKVGQSISNSNEDRNVRLSSRGRRRLLGVAPASNACLR